MTINAARYISQMPHFSMLPPEEIEKVAASARPMEIKRGAGYAEQGKTVIDSIYVVCKGTLALYDEKQDPFKPTGYIKSGEVFGGITILMNAGISLRTVRATEDCAGFAIPKTVFQDLCTKYRHFFEYFVENFSKNIFDKSLSAIIETGQVRAFISHLEPFSFLPEEEIERIAANLTLMQYPKDMILFVQGRSRVGHLYILQKGSAEQYYEENRKKTALAILAEGDIYGGISMLLNDGLAVRTLRVIESSYFFLLPKQLFMDVCERHKVFTEYFTDIFGKRMLEKSYSEIIAQSRRPRHEGMQFLNQPVSNYYREQPVFGDVGMSIRDAAILMYDERMSALFLKSPDNACAGVVTERDLTREIVAGGRDPGHPVGDIMSSPVRGVASSALVFEALMTMMREEISHLAVADANDNVVGILTSRDLLAAQEGSPLFILRDIAAAQTMEEITALHSRLPFVVRNLISSGAMAKNVNRFITMVSDAILEKVMEKSLESLGPPPARFAFMILGSEGRSEQTLKTDQDNALIIEDVPEDARSGVAAYFTALGEKICTLLDQAGYAFCTGGVMAKNPKWNQPLSVWKEYFSSWIYKAEGEDLLQASIFFDFRYGFGDRRLIDGLREHLFSSLGGWSGFFRHLTENALHFKPPIGFFRNFVVESKGDHRNAFDVKGAMTPIVDFARIYALKHGIEETNTLERLHQLYLKRVLKTGEYEEIEKAYSFLMQLRFARQIASALDENGAPNNYINPKKMTRIEQKMLKEIFIRTGKFQTKLELEFIGLT